MNTEALLHKAQDLLAVWTLTSSTPELNRLDLEVKAENLTKAVEVLVTERWGYLAAITGLDPGREAGIIEVLYHFCEGAAVLTLRVHTDRTDSKVPTLCKIIPAASLFERELREMFGVTVEGLLDNDYLFLPDDWQAGLYPLRKDALLE
jgi:Ni,Fe-hydrogenase III component G